MLPWMSYRFSIKGLVRAVSIFGCVAVLGGCAQLRPASGPDAVAAWGALSTVRGEAPSWAHRTLPGKTPSEFRFVRVDGRDAVAVHSASAASMLRAPIRVAPAELGTLRFSWKVPALIEQADLALRDRADSPVRVILAFEGDRSRFSARDAALAELVQTVTGEPMPYATLMYVWCNRRPAETVIRNARTDRIRKLVVQSGRSGLGQWLDYERDVRADYERVFGEKPGALVGIAIMSDSDNTRSDTRAWYGPVRLGSLAAVQ
jgi:hypothetical protein